MTKQAKAAKKKNDNNKIVNENKSLSTSSINLSLLNETIPFSQLANLDPQTPGFFYLSQEPRNWSHWPEELTDRQTDGWTEG